MSIGEIELIFLFLLFFIFVFGLLAKRLNTPYPIVMVIGGLAVGLVPGVPKIDLNPDLIFLVVLPPLLYAAAWTTSWRNFKYNAVSIFLLAFGLVAFTVVGVAFALPKVFDGFDWRLGLVLGAVAAPTDAIAATSIARRVGLPSRIVDLLEGESLFNDASGLLALQFAIGNVVRKHVPTWSEGIVTFFLLTAGGIGLGLLGGWIVDLIERRINDGLIEITLSILTPYAVYLAAEEVHASGVLAVVTCGLFLSRRSSTFYSPSVRLQIWPVWESLNFVLNGLVFALIGFQLSAIHSAAREYSLRTLVMDGVVFSACLVVLRLAWVFPGAGIAWIVRTRLLHQNERYPSARATFVLGWTGMRGVVSLAAALALPRILADGSPFPARNLIVFLTFCAICFTLVLQGITLPPLIRALGLAGGGGANREEQQARRALIEAGLSHIEQAKQRDEPEFAALYNDLALHYRERLALLECGNDENKKNALEHNRHTELLRDAVRVQRETALRMRDEGRMDDDILRRIERELDLAESRISISGDQN